MNVLEKNTGKTLEEDKELRIDNQYYLKNRKVIIDFDKLRDFILKIKNKINTITNEDIKKIKEKLKTFLET